MADLASLMMNQPQAPYGLGGIAPNTQPGGAYARAPLPYDPTGAQQAGSVPLGMPDPSGTTLPQLASPSAGMDLQKKLLLAKALMSAGGAGGGAAPVLPSGGDLNGILPGKYVG